MNDILWDGKMDVGWDELSILIKRTTSTFVESIRNVVEYSPNPESQALISNDSLERFNNISDLLAEIITDGVDGFLIKNRDINVFSNRVCQLIEDKNLRIQMGQAAIKSSQRYQADKIMPQWKAFFENLFSNERE